MYRTARISGLGPRHSFAYNVAVEVTMLSQIAHAFGSEEARRNADRIRRSVTQHAIVGTLNAHDVTLLLAMISEEERRLA